MVVLEHASHEPDQDVVYAKHKILKERILPLTRHHWLRGLPASDNHSRCAIG